MISKLKIVTKQRTRKIEKRKGITRMIFRLRTYIKNDQDNNNNDNKKDN